MLGKQVVQGAVFIVVLFAFALGFALFLQARRPLTEFPIEFGPAAVPDCGQVSASGQTANPAMDAKPMTVGQMEGMKGVCWPPGTRQNASDFIWLAALCTVIVIVGDAICILLFLRYRTPLERRTAAMTHNGS